MPFYYDFHQPHKDNVFLRGVRAITKPLGFHRSYNFLLFFMFSGAMIGFFGARVRYLDINGHFASQKIINADWLHWQSGHQYVGIIMHLVGVIPPCLLVPWQFLPVLRHKMMWLHRINGYLNAILLLIGLVGAFMVTRHSMGGSIESQVALGLLGVYSTFSLIMAYVNIKLLQIDQHRAWMLRAWFAAASIISQRIIQMPFMTIMSRSGNYYFSTPCRTIDYITSNYGGSQMMLYPSCAEDPSGWAAVKVNENSETSPEQIGVSINASFAASILVAFAVHAWGIELYLALTAAEGDRLKQVSYEKQLQRGWKRPGDAGLTPHKFGDLPAWQPLKTAKERKEEGGSESDGMMMHSRQQSRDGV